VNRESSRVVGRDVTTDGGILAEVVGAGAGVNTGS